jgi:ABC-type branched-subunit amino acid transport system substrate-binding protein
MNKTLGLVGAGLLAAAANAAWAQSISGPGVTDQFVTIGFAVPITGTGINYGTAFEDAANAYWKWAAAKGQKIAGRTVKVIAQDDQLRPDTATQVCSRLAESSFMIVGWQGSANAKACAAAATRLNTPYVMRGNDPSIGEFSGYFATSPTYAMDGEILARFIRERMGKAGTKVQLGAFNTSTNDVLVDSFEKGAAKQGLSAAPAVRVAFNSPNAEIVSAALKMRDAGTEVAALIFSPAILATVFSTWNAQNYRPKLILYANDQQAASLCETLSPEQTAALYAPNPWPTAEYVEKVQPGFKAAFREFGGREPNSNDVSVWATMEFVNKMLEKAGPDITRDNFFKRVGNTTIETPSLGPVTYKPGDHVSAASQFMLKLSCQEKLFLTDSRVSR